MRKVMLTEDERPRTLRSFRTFAHLWEWLANHPMTEHKLGPPYTPLRGSVFQEALGITYVLVDPKSKAISSHAHRNTQVRCWIEFGPAYYNEKTGSWMATTDNNLCVGGATFEQAIRDLCRRVLKHYGDYKLVPPTAAEIKRLNAVSRRMMGDLHVPLTVKQFKKYATHRPSRKKAR